MPVRNFPPKLRVSVKTYVYIYMYVYIYFCTMKTERDKNK